MSRFLLPMVWHGLTLLGLLLGDATACHNFYYPNSHTCPFLCLSCVFLGRAWHSKPWFGTAWHLHSLPWCVARLGITRLALVSTCIAIACDVYLFSRSWRCHCMPPRPEPHATTAKGGIFCHACYLHHDFYYPQFTYMSFLFACDCYLFSRSWRCQLHSRCM